MARAIGACGPDFDAAEAFVWQTEPEDFLPVTEINRVALTLLKGIDRMRDTLLVNTLRFARGLPANNALLWGARGMGKSSLVKAIHAEVGRQQRKLAADSADSTDLGADLKLIEIHREDIASLPRCLAHLRRRPERRFIVFCERTLPSRCATPPTSP